MKAPIANKSTTNERKEQTVEKYTRFSGTADRTRYLRFEQIQDGGRRYVG